HQAEASVKIKQGALDKARADLEHCTITSPIDGVVISRSVDVGQTVAASLQAPVIFAIANDLTKMQIDTNVAEADVGVVKIDQSVDFTVDAFPMEKFSAIHSNSRRLSNRLFPCFGSGTTFVPGATTTSPYATNRKSPRQPPLLHV